MFPVALRATVCTSHISECHIDGMEQDIFPEVSIGLDTIEFTRLLSKTCDRSVKN
jgi:hypothetical protein